MLLRDWMESNVSAAAIGGDPKMKKNSFIFLDVGDRGEGSKTAAAVRTQAEQAVLQGMLAGMKSGSIDFALILLRFVHGENIEAGKRVSPTSDLRSAWPELRFISLLHHDVDSPVYEVRSTVDPFYHRHHTSGSLMDVLLVVVAAMGIKDVEELVAREVLKLQTTTNDSNYMVRKPNGSGSLFFVIGFAMALLTTSALVVGVAKNCYNKRSKRRVQSPG